MWAILIRELRLQARQQSTHLLRVAGGALVLAACWWITRRDPRGVSTHGLAVFIGLNKLLLAALWIVGPMLTADCLARERRDGTLGLLFLTPLRARDVIVGKAAGHALRALTGACAAVPILVIPLLMGGVGMADVVRMLLLLLAVLALALTAGVAASAVTREWWRARMLATAFAAVAAAGLASLYVGAWTWRGGWRVGPGARVATAEDFGAAWWQNLQWWLGRHLGIAPELGLFWRSPAAGGASAESLWVAGVLLTVSLGLVGLSVTAAAWGLRRGWAGEVAGAGDPGRRVRSPSAVRAGFRSRAGVLDRSPARWWFGRPPSRPARAAAVLAMATAGLLAFVESGPTSLIPAAWIGRSLLALAGLAAVAGFRRERDAGGFEWLLPTPVPVTAWWWGRLRTLLAVWLPAMTVFAIGAGVADYLRFSRGTGEGLFYQVGRVTAAQYGVLPVHLAVVLAVGLRIGLSVRGAMPAWGLTLALTLGLRMLVLDRGQALLLGGPGGPPADWTGVILGLLAADLLVQAALGWVACRGTLRILRERRWGGGGG